MQRANLVLDHTLAILRATFEPVFEGGYIAYDHTDSRPRLNPAPTGQVLYWDQLMIGADTPRGLLPNVPVDAEKEDTRNLIEMDVQILSETASSTKASGGRPSSYELDMAIAVNVQMKEGRWHHRLVHALFGIIEDTLQRNSNLCHPGTGKAGAQDVQYQRYEINIGASGFLLLAVGEAIQTWKVTPLTNSKLGLVPQPSTCLLYTSPSPRD